MSPQSEDGKQGPGATAFGAIAHGAELPGRRLEGDVRPTSDALVFETRYLGPEGTAETLAIEMPFEGLTCRTGGWDDKTFYFVHEQQEGVEITVQGLEIAGTPEMAQLPIIRQALKSHRRLLAAFWGCSALILSVVFGSIAAGLIALFWFGQRLLETFF